MLSISIPIMSIYLSVKPNFRRFPQSIRIIRTHICIRHHPGTTPYSAKCSAARFACSRVVVYTYCAT